MIDRSGRDRLAELIRHYASGRMTNDEFEDRFDDLGLDQNQDKALWALFDATWCLYSDLKTYRLIGEDKLPKETRREVAKWILFLHSNQEYEWPFKGISTSSFKGPKAPFWISILNFFTLGCAYFWWAKGKIQPYLEALDGDWDSWPFYRKADFEEAKRDKVA